MKGTCPEKIKAKMEDDLLLSLDAKNGDSSLISVTMKEEEEMLMKEEQNEKDAEPIAPQKASHFNDNQFTKLDELLTQAQLYSEFLLEKMDSITFVFSCSHFLMNRFLSWLTYN